MTTTHAMVAIIIGTILLVCGLYLQILMSVAQLMEDVLIGALTISVAMCAPVELDTISMMMIIIAMVSTLTHNIVTNSLISLHSSAMCPSAHSTTERFNVVHW